ncbi:MAG: Ig-like domain-containing protein [Candidatus Veblenbacteria bacterium]|nr:Ig-like domain-containing protein [Candidatus Veblenbacteria bacterium]
MDIPRAAPYGGWTKRLVLQFEGNIPANQPPIVSLTSPTNNFSSPAGTNLTIGASASDPDGTVAKVEFFVGPVKIGEDTSSPYSATWVGPSVGAGYIITARATDNLGATTTSPSIVVVITATTPTNQPPLVSVTSPVNGYSSVAGTNIPITATASDPDGTVSKVEFFVGPVKIGEDTTSPYSATWVGPSVGAGYILTAKATDNSGAVTTSSGVMVSVNPVSPVSSSIVIVTPSPNYAFLPGKTIPVRIVNKGSSFSSVGFFVNGNLVSTDTSVPYEYYIQNAVVGNYNVYTVGHSGTSTFTSSTVTFSVQNKPARPSFCFSGSVDNCQAMFNTWAANALSSYNRFCNQYLVSNANFGWGEGQYLTSLADAYEFTENTAYLNRIVSDADSIFSLNGFTCPYGDSSGRPMFRYQGYGTNPSSVPKEWGWYGDDYYNYEYDDFVSEGVFMISIAKFIEIVYNDPALWPAYKVKADQYLDITENDLYPKWDRRGLFNEIGDGSGVYRSHDDPAGLGSDSGLSLPHNRQTDWALTIMSLYRVTGDVKYRDRAAKIFQHLNKNYYEENGINNWNYWDHAGLWDYDLGEPSSLGYLKEPEREDHRCGYRRIATELAYGSWENRLIFSSDDMQELITRNQIYNLDPPDDLYSQCIFPVMLGFYDKSNLQRSFNVIKNEVTGLRGYEILRFMLALDAPVDGQQSYYKGFDIPIYETFNGVTTNFNTVSDLTSVSNVVLEKTGKGKVEYGSQSLNMVNLFLDGGVKIENRFAEINQGLVPSLNVPATVTLYNVNDNSPIIMRNGATCSSCNVLSSGTNVKFTIPGAGVYTLAPKKILIFSDGFESGNFNSWSRLQNSGSLSITTAEHNSGTRAMKVTPGSGVEMYAETSAFNVEDYIYKVSFKLSSDFAINNVDREFSLGAYPTSSKGKNFLMIDRKIGGVSGVGTTFSALHLYTQYTDDTGFPHWVPQNRRDGPQLQTGRWYTIEYHFKSDPNRYVEMYLDGEFIGRSTVGATTQSRQTGFRLGIQPEVLFGGNLAGSIYFDNFEVYEITSGQVAGAATGPDGVLASSKQLPRTGGLPIEGILYLSWLVPWFKQLRRRQGRGAVAHESECEKNSVG